MAAHRHSNVSWFDTPVNPAIGILMFVAGLVAFFTLSLFLLAKVSGF